MWTRAREFRIVAGVTLLHAAFAGLAASPLFFVPNVATAQRVFGGSNGEANLFEDVGAYRTYASGAIAGKVPYRDYDVEYPIGAFPLFVLPRLVAAGPIAYRWAFALEMLLVDAGLVWLVRKRGERTIGAGRALAWYSLGLLALGSLPIARFDLAPTALAFAATMAWDSGRVGLGGGLAALGGLMKVFPGLAALPPIAARREGWGRGLATLAAVGIGGGLAWSLLGGSGVARSLRYHSGRGLEIESLWAGLLMAWAKLAGWPLAHDFNHSSVELIARGAPAFAAMAPVVQVIAIGGVLFARDSRRGGTMRSAAACLMAFALFGKVLSPQYVIWFLPFVATLDGDAGRRARPLVLIAAVLTSLVYFWAGVGLLMFHPLAVAILNARNFVLLALWWTLARRPG